MSQISQKVFLVCLYDIDENIPLYCHKTIEGAEKKLFELRDKSLKVLKNQCVQNLETQEIIEILSDDDYKKWPLAFFTGPIYLYPAIEEWDLEDYDTPNDLTHAYFVYLHGSEQEGIISVYKTFEEAEKKLFKIRDEIIEEISQSQKEDVDPKCFKILQILSGDDYEKWPSMIENRNLQHCIYYPIIKKWDVSE